MADVVDPDGTDRIYVGSNWSGKEADGYAQNYTAWKNGGLQDRAFGEDDLTITMTYECSDVYVKIALFQLCIDDFQSLTWGSNFTVSLNGKNAPFIAELLNYVNQTGPVSYIIGNYNVPLYSYDTKTRFNCLCEIFCRWQKRT